MLILHRSHPQGIGRMILKEEMKARSGCHDNDQWGSRRSSRYSSKEALNNQGFNSLNGCKSEVVSVFDTGDFDRFTPVLYITVCDSVLVCSCLHFTVIIFL